MVSKNPPPAGSDFGLRPSQGQSRFLDTINFSAYPSNIFRARFLLFYISIIFYKGPEKGNTGRVCPFGTGPKSFFRTYQSLFVIYPLYKFRELSSFIYKIIFPKGSGREEKDSTVKVKSVFRHHPIPSLP